MNKMKLLISISFLLLIFLDKNILGFDNPFSGAKNSLLNSEFDNQEPNDYESFEQEDLISSIDDFVKTPKGGISWNTFSETEMDEYTVVDDEDYEWIGVRPKFKEKLKKLDGREILVQGYMFPLDQSEKQNLFLLGPFPVSCPYHFHTSANLIIEVHAKTPILFSYDPINITGKLELVEIDDDYNIFYRMKESIMIK